MTLTDLQEPDVKLIHRGTGALSDAETLALILAGLDPAKKAHRLLEMTGYNYHQLARYTYEELKGFGLSHLQAIRLIAVIEFAKRKGLHMTQNDDKQVKSSHDAAELVKPLLVDLDHEEVWVLLLNRQNRVIKTFQASKGGISGSVCDSRIIYREAVLLLASGVILAHNHPSGNLSPSDSDIRLTQQVKEAGRVFNIQLLDHIIIAGAEYYSFADSGLI